MTKPRLESNRLYFFMGGAVGSYEYSCNLLTLSCLCHPYISNLLSHFPQGFPFSILAGYGTRSDLKVGKAPQSTCANQETLPLKQRKYVARLEELREALENSPFFKTHEV